MSGISALIRATAPNPGVRPSYSDREAWDEYRKRTDAVRKHPWRVETWFQPNVLNRNRDTAIYNNTYVMPVERTLFEGHDAELVTFEVTWRVGQWWSCTFLRVSVLRSDDDYHVQSIEVNMNDNTYGYGLYDRFTQFFYANELPFMSFSFYGRPTFMHREDYKHLWEFKGWSHTSNIRDMRLSRKNYGFQAFNLYAQPRTPFGSAIEPTHETYYQPWQQNQWMRYRTNGWVELYTAKDNLPGHAEMFMNLMSKHAGRPLFTPFDYPRPAPPPF